MLRTTTKKKSLGRYSQSKKLQEPSEPWLSLSGVVQLQLKDPAQESGRCRYQVHTYQRAATTAWNAPHSAKSVGGGEQRCKGENSCIWSWGDRKEKKRTVLPKWERRGEEEKMGRGKKNQLQPEKLKLEEENLPPKIMRACPDPGRGSSPVYNRPCWSSCTGTPDDWRGRSTPGRVLGILWPEGSRASKAGTRTWLPCTGT